jgi:hypothetical protein
MTIANTNQTDADEPSPSVVIQTIFGSLYICCPSTDNDVADPTTLICLGYSDEHEQYLLIIIRIGFDPQIYNFNDSDEQDAFLDAFLKDTPYNKTVGFILSPISLLCVKAELALLSQSQFLQ